MKPTKLHYFFAGDWPVRLWMGTFTAGFGVGAAVFLRAPLPKPLTGLDELIFAGVVLLLALAGWFSSILFGWFVLGPIFFARGYRNGGPFEAGDEVVILCGQHRGRIGLVTRVTELWYAPGQFAHVEITGENERESEGEEQEAIFFPVQIFLRRPRPYSSQADPAENSKGAI